jgi:hypothetical protein
MIIFIFLWLTIGFLTIRFDMNSYYVYWYRNFNEHFINTEYYSFKKEIIFTLIFTLTGFITLILLGLDSGFHPKSKGYFPNSLWMIFYNKEKVEKLIK